MKNAAATTLKTYGYDGLSRRVSETAGGTTTDLYYSADGRCWKRQVGGDDHRAVRVEPGVRGRPGAAGPGHRCRTGRWTSGCGCMQDANLNVTALVDGSGAVVERYAYDPFGVRTVYDGVTRCGAAGASYDFQHGFQGMAYDAVSGAEAPACPAVLARLWGGGPAPTRSGSTPGT